MTKIYEVNKPMGINKIKIKIKLIKPYLVPFTLRGFFKLHKIFGLLGATWGSFFYYAAQKIWAVWEYSWENVFQDAWKNRGIFGILSLPGKIMKVENFKCLPKKNWALLKTSHAQKVLGILGTFWWGLIILGTL